MTIQTKFHGELELDTLTQWAFPKGLPGLEDETSFVLLPIEGNDSFQVMQSVSTPTVALIVANPYTIVSDYSFAIDDPTLELLGIESQEDLMILSVMSMKDPFESSTVNLQAPLIFNIENNTAKQMILNDTTYSLRTPISAPAQKGAR
ncbi:flagellar assembly factor FliW [Sporosarcina sp. NCCP-2716]|uniref:flagellar assembly protein FliW n=1 Tax=Sporosarcina sp. NCCP-2716 TaxID=2943679 RepID=UPI0020414783|nr:flagellar assembly protein FliW [Sporosarcina sp. NCCP-2716]GKV69404.1 flagellar assembly factor FliW [Sporosarcina sp. NCCP-2716]